MLDLISFVGVDEFTNLQKLVEFDLQITDLFLEADNDNPPYVEYGFLFSETRSLTADARYPSMDFIRKSTELLNTGLASTSLHLCGKEAVDRYLNSDQEFNEMGQHSRIQLNFNMSNYSEDDLIENLLDVSDKHFFPVIVQSNKSKKSFIEKLIKRMNKEYMVEGVMPNIDILHDGSGGFGREIEVVQRPYSNIFTGYAGGLKPGNIGKVLQLIENTIPPEAYDAKVDSDAYYLDMESGVRTDNKFDLDKCKQVVNEAVKFFAEELHSKS